MNKKIAFIFKNINETAPVNQRISAFKKVYKENGYDVISINYPTSFVSFLRCLYLIYLSNCDEVFITMPPFRYFLLICIPFKKTILDIRDGWSIAMKSGYGQTIKPKKIKSFYAQLIERFFLKKASNVITCTPGLVQYLEEKIKIKNIVLIPNGHSVSKMRFDKKQYINTKKSLTFVCFGKFSEYGTKKIKIILQTIIQRYPDNHHIIKVFGASFEENKWINQYIKNKFFNIEFTILPRINKSQVHNEIKNADIGIAVIRDPNYDLGTKAFEYVGYQLPILNYFHDENNFTIFFKGCFDTDFSNINPKIFNREYFIQEKYNTLLETLY